jgi:hypothetical protein
MRPMLLGMPLKYQMWLTRGGQLDMAHALAADLGLVTSTPQRSQILPL